jgi:predicted glycosyltransferase
VCMGGYNTLAEAVSRGTRTVCVPRVVPRTEQLIRAKAFARLGLLRYVHPDELTPDRLRAEVDGVLGRSREELAETARTRLGFDGAARAAEHLHELYRQVKPSEPATLP